MKQKLKALTFVLTLLTVCSCSNEFEFPEVQDIQKINEILSKDEKSILKEKFSFSLMKSLNEDQSLRELIKEESLKMFNKDYEVLIYTIKDEKLKNGLTFEETINKNASNNFKLSNLLKIEPTLTLLVPKLPMDSFSAEKWNTQSEIPAIAIRTNYTNEIPLITPELKLELIPSDVIPGFPVIVVKNNERVVSNIENPNIKSLQTKTIYEKDGIIIKFWAKSFDNLESFNDKYSEKITAKFHGDIDPVLLNAYNIYEQQNPNLDGWQRDYIYYSIQPSSPNGPFKYDYQEHLTTFNMNGDAKNAYNTISDQTDPTFSDDHSVTASHWTGGNYEFKVRTIINSRNGVGSELITGFTASPDQLFVLEYESYTTGYFFWTKSYYKLKSIKNSIIYVDIPLINWDLKNYSSSIKTEIEEVDITTTTTVDETNIVKFTNNFQIDTSIPLGQTIKIGLKAGTALETTDSQTVKKTFTQGNDQLGSSIINFADKVVIGSSDINIFFIKKTIWRTREYSTGLCTFTIEPKKVQ